MAKDKTEAKATNERTRRYDPKAEAIPMRAGTVADILAQAMFAEGGATIDEMKAILVEKYGDPDKFSTNYVSGYIWDLGQRGYGIEVDGQSKFYLLLPEGTSELVYRAEKVKPEPKPKAEPAPKAEKAAKKGKTSKKGKDAAPAAEGGDDDSGEAQSGDAPQEGQ